MSDSRQASPLTLTEASEAIRAGRTTAAALVERALALAEAWQPAINAFIRRDDDAAGAAAADPRPGPLAGIPMAHKDMVYRAGRVSTCGSVLRRDWRATSTATVLARLDAAGAIDLGTLNMSEWAGGATGHNIHFGPARNPWNPAHVTGGSSSGSAAAVAAGIVFAALGSDTGGSIRVPAACCGVVGLKPTWGRVSRAGTLPRAPSLDCIGPLARTVEDVAAVLAVIAGPDPADSTAADRPAEDWQSAARGEVRGMTLGVPERWFFEELAPSVAEALDRARRVFEGLGVRVVTVDVPEAATVSTLQGAVTMAEAASLHAPMMAACPEAYARGLFGRQQAGLAIPAATYRDALRLRPVMLASFCRSAFARADALFLPALPIEVPTLAETDVEDSDDYGLVHARMVRTTRGFNYLGLPAMSVPCGLSANGLPVAFQLAAPPFAEAVLIRLGAAFQRATGWHRAVPRPPS